jgi:DNA transformation protein
MRVTDGFRAFVLEQLAGVKSVRARAMFGGLGLYSNDVFFGIVAADTLYLKVDDTNRVRYEAEGMRAFKPYADRPSTMSYYQVPARVLEDRDELTAWALASVRVATQSRC